MAPICVALNRNKTFTISDNNKKSIRLSKGAINVLKQNKNRILRVIKTGNGDTKLYWKLKKAEILIKKINSPGRNSGKSTLCIVENSTIIELDKDSFVDFLIEALRLIRLEQCPRLKVNEFYILTSYKKVKINSKENSFSVLDEKNDFSITLPLAALEKVIQQQRQIFADLEDGGNGSESINYWTNGVYCVNTKSFKDFRILCFEPKFSFKGVCIRHFTLQRLIDLLGEFFDDGESFDTDLSEDESENYGEKLEINNNKSIEFCTNKKKCVITHRGDRKREIKLPIDALETLLKHEKEILAEFDVDATLGLAPDYFHEYWRNEIHAIRSVTYKKEMILRFDDIKRNDYFFGMKEKAFLALMKIYKEVKSK